MGNGHRTRRDRRARHRGPPGPGADIIAGVGGIAPTVGPLLGAVILQLSHWRVSFWVVAALGLVMTLAVVLAVPKSLPPERRHGGGLHTFLVAGRQVLGHRSYVGYLVVAGSAMGALFAYVATSAFALQSMNGISPLAYSIDFAANAAGMTVASLIAARLAGRIATRTVILVGQLAALAAGVAMLIGAIWFGTPLILAIICFFVMMTAQGLIGPNGGPSPPSPSPTTPAADPPSSVSFNGSRPASSPHCRPRRRAHRRSHGQPHDRRRRRLHDRTARHREARGNADPSGARCAGLS
jgi:Major Facilitator Superfamily